MAEWGAKGRHAARLSLLLDYGYILSYGAFFALAGFAVRDTARVRDCASRSSEYLGLAVG